jgi:hypothetical protein
VYARHLLGGEAAQQSDRMSQHGILGARGFGHWRKEKEICGRPKEGKTEGLCVNNASSVSNAIAMKLLRATWPPRRTSAEDERAANGGGAGQMSQKTCSAR